MLNQILWSSENMFDTKINKTGIFIISVPKSKTWMKPVVYSESRRNGYSGIFNAFSWLMYFKIGWPEIKS